MKLNLLFNSNDVRAGYQNIDAYTQEGDGKIEGNVFNLNEIACNAEVVELIALDIIDRIPLPQITQVLGHWLSKIRRGGTITIGGLNLPSVTKAFYRKEIDLVTMNQLFFGKQDTPTNNKKCALDITWIESVLKSEGFKIIQSRLENVYYYIKAERV